MIKVLNNSEYNLQHGLPLDDKNKFYTLEIGKVAELPDEIAEIWLKMPGVVEYVEPKDLKAIEEKANAEKTALNKEIAELKAQLKNKETGNTKTSKTNNLKKNNK